MSGKIEISRDLAQIFTAVWDPRITDPATIRTLQAQYRAACDELREILTAPVVERQPVRPVVWCIPVNGDWFYGTKEQCEREYAEYTADFTAEDFDEAGPTVPEPLACLDKVKELNQ